VSVEGVAETGNVRITLGFDDWKAGRVAPATFEIPLPKPSDEQAPK
jgi:hypothetical protein